MTKLNHELHAEIARLRRQVEELEEYVRYYKEELKGKRKTANTGGPALLNESHALFLSDWDVACFRDLFPKSKKVYPSTIRMLYAMAKYKSRRIKRSELSSIVGINCSSGSNVLSVVVSAARRAIRDNYDVELTSKVREGLEISDKDKTFLNSIFVRVTPDDT